MNATEAIASITDAIEEIIKQKGLKKSAVAKKIGLTPQQFSDMLNGRRIIKAWEIPLLAKALGVQPNDFFTSIPELYGRSA